MTFSERIGTFILATLATQQDMSKYWRRQGLTPWYCCCCCSDFMNNTGPIVTQADKQKSKSKTRKLAEKVVSKATVGGQ